MNQSSAPPRSWWPLALALLVGGSAILRIAAALDDLWLDEIWALDIAKMAHSVGDVFTSLHHETNHYLTTIWMHLVGAERGNWFGYRVPSILFGLGTVILAWRIGRQRSATEGWLAATLCGLSYPLILYASEARGYSGCVFFAFAAYLALQSYLRTPRVVTGVIFALCEIGGLVSHLAFVNILGSTVAWTLAHHFSKKPETRAAPARLLLVHAAPWLFAAWLYFVDVRFLTIGGGTNASSLIGSFGSALAWAVGSTGTSRVTLLACIAAIILLHAGCRLLLRERTPEGVFLVSAILVFPVLLVLLRSSDVVYPRYFLLSIAFFLLLLARIAADAWHRDRRARRIALGLVTLSVALNLWSVTLLLVHGRARGAELVRYLSHAKSSANTMVIGSDNDVRLRMILEFYANVIDGKSLNYCEAGSWPPGGVEFFIRTQEAYEWPWEEKIRDYTLIRTFRAAPLAGLHYYVYQRNKSP